MQDLYIYVDKNIASDCLKYGLKLSENCNKVLSLSTGEKSGILAYLAPKDSSLYLDDNYTCIRVKTDGINATVYNKVCENTDLIDDFTKKFEDYKSGEFESPEAIITSTLLGESLSVYNKILDKPLLVQNSREYYYEKCIDEILETDMFSKYELYQMLLILGDQKRVLNTEKYQNVKVYTDQVSGKKYTKRSNS